MRAFVRRTSDLSKVPAECEIVYGDVTRPQTLDHAMRGVDTVFHVAADVGLGLVDAKRMTRVNAGGTRAALHAAAAAGVRRFIYCGTIGTLGHTGATIADESFVRQQRTFSSPYDRSKWLAQRYVDRAPRSLETVSVLPSGIFGLGDPHFTPAVRAFRAGRLPVWVGGARPTGIVHVRDVASAMVLCAERAPANSHYILSAGELTTRRMFEILGEDIGRPPPRELPRPAAWVVSEVLEQFGRLSGKNPPLSRERYHYVYERLVRVCAAKAKRELGWTPMDPETVVRSLLGK